MVITFKLFIIDFLIELLKPLFVLQIFRKWQTNAANKLQVVVLLQYWDKYFIPFVIQIR